jgi:multidrug resistance efflux pump
VEAQYRKTEALHRVSEEENRKVDAGTREQVVASSYQLWLASKTQAQLAEKTYERVCVLYGDSVVPRQRYDEAEAAMMSARAVERSAYEQYRLAKEGMQREDREASRNLMSAAASSVDEVAALLVDAKLVAPDDGQIANINAQLGAQAVQNQATKDSFQLLQERLCAETKERRCSDNAIVNYANATFYPKLVADITTGTTTTAHTLYNPLPAENCGC